MMMMMTSCFRQRCDLLRVFRAQQRAFSVFTFLGEYKSMTGQIWFS